MILIAFLEDTLYTASAISEQMRRTLQVDLRLLRTFQPVTELEDESYGGSGPYLQDDLYDRLTESVVVFPAFKEQVQHPLRVKGERQYSHFL